MQNESLAFRQISPVADNAPILHPAMMIAALNCRKSKSTNWNMYLIPSQTLCIIFFIIIINYKLLMLLLVTVSALSMTYNLFVDRARSTFSYINIRMVCASQFFFSNTFNMAVLTMAKNELIFKRATQWTSVKSKKEKEVDWRQCIVNRRGWLLFQAAHSNLFLQ